MEDSAGIAPCDEAPPLSSWRNMRSVAMMAASLRLLGITAFVAPLVWGLILHAWHPDPIPVVFWLAGRRLQHRASRPIASLVSLLSVAYFGLGVCLFIFAVSRWPWPLWSSHLTLTVPYWFIVSAWSLLNAVWLVTTCLGPQASVTLQQGLVVCGECGHVRDARRACPECGSSAPPNLRP